MRSRSVPAPLTLTKSDQKALEGQINDETRIIAGKVSGVSVAKANTLSSEANLNRAAAAIGQAKADVANAKALGTLDLTREDVIGKSASSVLKDSWSEFSFDNINSENGEEEHRRWESQRNGFLMSVRETGATLVEIGPGEAALEAAISDRTAGIIWFAGSRRRVTIPFDQALIDRTKELLAACKDMARAGRIPLPLVDSPKCPRCSLVAICLPDETNRLLHELVHGVQERLWRHTRHSFD